MYYFIDSMPSFAQIIAFLITFLPLLGLIVWTFDSNSAVARLFQIIVIAVGSVAISIFGLRWFQG